MDRRCKLRIGHSHSGAAGHAAHGVTAGVAASSTTVPRKISSTSVRMSDTAVRVLARSCVRVRGIWLAAPSQACVFGIVPMSRISARISAIARNESGLMTASFQSGALPPALGETCGAFLIFLPASRIIAAAGRSLSRKPVVREASSKRWSHVVPPRYVRSGLAGCGCGLDRLCCYRRRIACLFRLCGRTGGIADPGREVRPPNDACRFSADAANKSRRVPVYTPSIASDDGG